MTSSTPALARAQFIKALNRILWFVFGLSVVAMIFTAFIWPITISTNTASVSLRVACQLSFGSYIVAMFGRLTLRIIAERSEAKSD